MKKKGKKGVCTPNKVWYKRGRSTLLPKHLVHKKGGERGKKGFKTILRKVGKREELFHQCVSESERGGGEDV